MKIIKRKEFVRDVTLGALGFGMLPAFSGAAEQNTNQKVDASSGMNYAPTSKPKPVCKPGEFIFSAVSLNHGHIYGMSNGLIEAGGKLKYVFDPDPQKVEKFCQTYPGVKPAKSLQQVLDDSETQLIAAAAVPSDRGPLGVKVMQHGKDYFTDKTPFTELSHLEEARITAAKTKRKYMVYFSERLHVEAAVYAGQLIDQDAIGRVIQVVGFGPHRLNAKLRPEWFFKRKNYGGILADIGSHQIEQFLHFTSSTDASIPYASVENYGHPEYPELQDFGEAILVGNTKAKNYYRVDWFTPDGLSTWGDGRTFILGTKGYIELRKYLDVGKSKEGDHLFLVTHKEETHIPVKGKVGFPFFGAFILDCLNRTEKAMTQEHAFKAAELCLRCQALAEKG